MHKYTYMYVYACIPVPCFVMYMHIRAQAPKQATCFTDDFNIYTSMMMHIRAYTYSTSIILYIILYIMHKYTCIYSQCTYIHI
jgi:hypothetical protein